MKLILSACLSICVLHLCIVSCVKSYNYPTLSQLFQKMGAAAEHAETMANNVINGVQNADRTTKWDAIQVGWPFMRGVPLTEQDAINSKKFHLKDNFCSEESDQFTRSAFRGRRYWNPTDPSVMLLYGPSGRLVGIQNGIPKEAYTPLEKFQGTMFADDGTLWTRTAYFTEPGSICQRNNANAVQNSAEIAEGIYIQTGQTYDQYLQLPRYERDIKKQPDWVQGKTFPSQGKHYWYKMKKNMKEEDMLPFFPLYSGYGDNKQLMAFGFTTNVNLRSSPNYVHPVPFIAKIVMGEQTPDFIMQDPSYRKMSNIIVYLVAHPYLQANG